MSGRDDFHLPVRRALEKEGWTITDDPLFLSFEGITLRADLGAQRRFAAQRGEQKIAVEVKDFDRASAISELEKTMGQLLLYQWSLDENEPDRELFLAVSEDVYYEHFEKPLFVTVVRRNKINLLVFDDVVEEITQWIRQ